MTCTHSMPPMHQPATSCCQTASPRLQVPPPWNQKPENLFCTFAPPLREMCFMPSRYYICPIHMNLCPSNRACMSVRARLVAHRNKNHRHHIRTRCIDYCLPYQPPPPKPRPLSAPAGIGAGP